MQQLNNKTELDLDVVLAHECGWSTINHGIFKIHYVGSLDLTKEFIQSICLQSTINISYLTRFLETAS